MKVSILFAGLCSFAGYDREKKRVRREIETKFSHKLMISSKRSTESNSS